MRHVPVEYGCVNRFYWVKNNNNILFANVQSTIQAPLLTSQNRIKI